MRLAATTAAVVAALLIGSPAKAQDADWFGAYIGAHGGLVNGDVGVVYDTEDEGGPINGFFGGVFAGYNIPVNGLIVGIDADVGAGDVSGIGRLGEYTYKLNWDSHLRGRVGFSVDKVLFFLAGGLAVASHTLTVDYGGGMFGNDTQVHFGPSIGAGAELALSDNVKMRVEYVYDRFGSRTYTDQQPIPETYNVSLDTHTVRIGILVGL